LERIEIRRRFGLESSIEALDFREDDRLWTIPSSGGSSSSLRSVFSAPSSAAGMFRMPSSEKSE
jgi:cation diffusion facilitator CzcD-associated flavoprotein CzcO